MNNQAKNTAERILDVTQDLIQRRGYNAISFNHIAEKVGIKKPSIVHHFPGKADLGKAVVKRYREVFSAALQAIAEDDQKTAMDAFDFYCTPYLDYGGDKEKICLCGALAGEFLALPKVMQKEVAAFFDGHLRWLEDILKRGLENGEFHFTGKPAAMAQLVLDTLQGALIVKRATGTSGHVVEVMKTLRSKLEKPE